MFVNDALAQTAAAAAPQASVASTLIQLALIFIVFYFILIRPQQKKISQHQAMLEAIKKGDKIITGGGIYGTVTKADGIKLEVKIAEGLSVTVNRATVRDVVNDEGENAAPAPKAKKQSKAVEKK